MIGNFSHFHPVSRFAIDNLLYVSGLGYKINDSSFYIDRKYFDDYQIVHVLNGIFHLEQHGKQYEIKKGESVIFDLREKHKYFLKRNHYNEILWMHFNGNCCETLLNNLSLPHIYISDIPEQIIRKCVLLIANKPPNYELKISLNIYKLLMDVILVSNASLKGIDPLIKKVDDFIMANKSVSITLDMLSKHTNINKYHLCHLFKEKVSRTPIQYVLFKKIDIAKDMLLFSNMKISQIYSQLGFADQSHFSRTFYKIVGMFPTQFKKMHY